MANKAYGAIKLTGGTPGALDFIDGAGLQDLDVGFATTLTGTYVYSLDSDSGATESEPDIIEPDVNAGTKRWILVSALAVISNVDVDTGAETVDTIPDTIADGAMWFYVVKKGTALRTGIVMAAWNAAGNTTEYTETSTVDIGDTSDLTLAVDISSDNVRLRATAGSDDWIVRTQRMVL